NILITSLQNFLSSLQQIENNYVIISEKNIYQHYPNIFKKIESTIVLDINEHNKSLSTTETIWKFLLEKNITKSHQIFIIGGGVLHDVAMFACSVFKRGLNIISVPTTLLAMVDAAIGGKNGINYLHYKNIIGDIYLPQQNIIIHDFLNTLPNEQLLSGWAEILKIALVSDKAFYHQCIQHLEKSILPNLDIIQYAIQLKTNIIQDDLYDNNKRQLLNFGHSIAHAIEGWYDEQNNYIPHGFAVAQGIITEAYISTELSKLSKYDFNIISENIKNYFPLQKIEMLQLPILLDKINQDKKNTLHEWQFTLLNSIGSAQIKVSVKRNIVENAILNTFQIDK
ncbi:MAG: 3-dehydroquinate synthase family protein, partial [Bacteroidota bacterium]